MSGIVKGVSKGVGKAFKGIKKTIGNLVDASLHPGSTLKKASSMVFDPVTKMLKPAKIPDAPQNPLMPDLESIEKSRRRRRNAKLGRVETILSDSLGG